MGGGQKAGKKYDPDMLWYIHGKAYDLTDWVKHHPGTNDSVSLVVCVLGEGGGRAPPRYERFNPRASLVSLACMLPRPPLAN